MKGYNNVNKKLTETQGSKFITPKKYNFKTGKKEEDWASAVKEEFFFEKKYSFHSSQMIYSIVNLHS